MDGQDPNTENADGQAPEASNEGAPAPDNDVSARLALLEKEIERRDAELSKVRGEAADRRVALRKEEEARQAALLEQGEFKALAESQAKQIEELKATTSALEALKDKAAAYDAWEKQELESIEAAKEGLPPEAQAALDAAGSLDAKRAFLNAINVNKGPSAKAAASAGAGAPNAKKQPTDFDGLRGREFINAIKADPEAYWSQNGAGAQKESGSVLGRMMRRNKG